MTLTETKGRFKLIGKVVGLDGAEVRTGNNNGKEYRAVKFSVQTSPTNRIFVELFGQEQEKVYVINNSKKDEKGKKEVRDLPFASRNNAPKGFELFGTGTTRLGIKDAEGEVIRKSKANYDAVKLIKSNFKDGDSVYVGGELRFGVYNDKPIVNYQINSFSQQKDPINFESEKFKETASFEQEFVVTDLLKDDDIGRLVVNGYTIDYKESFYPAQFTVDTLNMKEFAAKFSKRIKPWDWVKVVGLCRNEAITMEAPEVETEDDWGGEDPAGIDGNVVTDYVRELLITNVKDHQKKMYKEEDFVTEEDLVEDTSVEDDDLPF